MFGHIRGTPEVDGNAAQHGEHRGRRDREAQEPARRRALLGGALSLGTRLRQLGLAQTLALLDELVLLSIRFVDRSADE